MRAILVINPKGGCGKTTLVTNLASYYAMWGVRTAIVDYDTQQSSLEWLASRGPEFEPIEGLAGWHGQVRPHAGTQRVVMDAPAHVDDRRAGELIDRADVVLVPVLPSPIDMRAAAHFLGEFILAGGRHGKRVGIVANRVRENTVVFHTLEEFLDGVRIPTVTSLRDTQNYIRAAARGIGIFEMAPYLVQQDLDQWRPLIKWVEAKR